MYKIFYRIALRIYKWACIHKIPFPSNGQVKADLERLHPGENKMQVCAEYYVGKLAKSLMICLVAVFLGIALSWQSKEGVVLNEAGEIARGGYEEEPKQIEVECVLPGGMQSFQVRVDAQILNEERVFELYDDFHAELHRMILGANDSLQNVTEKLQLQDSYEGYPFTVEWESADSGVVKEDGTVVRGDSTRETELCATISYENWKWEQTFRLRVPAMIFTEEETVHNELQQLLAESEQNSRMQDVWKLPESWRGYALKWREKTQNNGTGIILAGLIVAVFVYFLADKDLHDSVEKRKQRMKKEYPDIVHKLALYLGAGMTIRRAFQKIAEEYQAAGKRESPICEEILHVCREFRAGVSEGVVYERFGKRTGLQEYVRLSTLLTQNLKKGNSTLLQRLREEAEKASTERIQYSKRLGEEAVTKLLLPMVLMLLVVMLMIMIPAFSSMGT